MSRATFKAETQYIPIGDDGDISFLYDCEPPLPIDSLQEDQVTGLVRNILAAIIVRNSENAIYQYNPVDPSSYYNMRVLLKPDEVFGSLRYVDSEAKDKWANIVWDPLDETIEDLIRIASRASIATYNINEFKELRDYNDKVSGAEKQDFEEVLNTLNDLFRFIIYSLVEPEIRFNLRAFTQETLHKLDSKYSAADRRFTLKIWGKWYTLQFNTKETPSVTNLPLRGYSLFSRRATKKEIKAVAQQHSEALYKPKQIAGVTYFPLRPDILRNRYQIDINQKELQMFKKEKYEIYTSWEGDEPTESLAVLLVDPKSRLIQRIFTYEVDAKADERRILVRKGLHAFEYDPWGRSFVEGDDVHTYSKFIYAYDHINKSWQPTGLHVRSSRYKSTSLIKIPVQNLERVDFEVVSFDGQPYFLEMYAEVEHDGKRQRLVKNREGWMVLVEKRSPMTEVFHHTATLRAPEFKEIPPVEKFLD